MADWMADMSGPDQYEIGSMTGRSTFVTTLQDGSQQLGYNLAVHVPGGLIRQVSSWISLFTSDTFRFVQTTPNA